MEKCYVCGTNVPLNPPEIFSDGSTYIKELDENKHAICRQCQSEAFKIVDDTISWSSSEDHDLYLVNCAVEGLKRGRSKLVTS